jgi:hypothetical protein
VTAPSACFLILLQEEIREKAKAKKALFADSAPLWKFLLCGHSYIEKNLKNVISFFFFFF